ncbi:hypothetical protein CDAR_467341 [Caerostris darwini]|uniref:Uncharacterized protein n=1 Tax=Caerostris darwini TaxID=1538125 RepID=A0AAV4U260_9ARAC|nr:hypothetical protein CDAR_467341 [Caerostris darwini]
MLPEGEKKHLSDLLFGTCHERPFGVSVNIVTLLGLENDRVESSFRVINERFWTSKSCCPYRALWVDDVLPLDWMRRSEEGDYSL